jgi:predicted nucleic acid-binding protein
VNHCIDASVATKWIVPEADSALALRLLEDSVKAGDSLVAPPHVLAEVVSAIYRRLRAGEVSQSVTNERLAAFNAIPLELSNPEGLGRRAIELSVEFGWEYSYDAFYLALGELLNCPVWTADQEFFEDAHGVYPRLRLLSELGVP